MKRIHVVGAPRTGTTLMMLGLTYAFEFDHAPDVETSVLVPPPPATQFACTKLPREVAVAERLLAADPDQYFICMERDPRDVIVSKHERAPDRYWVSLHSLRRAWERARGLRAHPRFITVKYENLVRDPEAVQRTLTERMPFLRCKGRMADFHRGTRFSAQSLRAIHKVRPIDTGSIGAWRQHKPRIAGQVAQHGSPTPELIEHGYEPDASWEHELDGVKPDLTPSFWPENDDSGNRARFEAVLAGNLPLYLAARGLLRA